MKLNSEEIREIAAEKTKEFGEDVLIVSKQAVFGIAEMLGEAAARYKIYVEQENAKAALVAQQQRFAQMQQAYINTGYLLQTVINNTASITNLISVPVANRLYVPQGQRYNRQMTCAYYQALYQWDGTSASQVQQKLQWEIWRICQLSNLPVPRIQVRFLSHNRCIIRVG